MASIELKVVESKVYVPGECFTLKAGEHLIGRSEEGSSLVLKDPVASRKQCRICFEEDREPTVENLSNSNPTLLNQQSFSGVELLNDGDRLLLGDTTFEITIDSPNLVRTGIMSVPKVKKDPPPATVKEKRPEVAPPPKNKENLFQKKSIRLTLLGLGAFFFLLILLSFFGNSSKGSALPTPNDCTLVYSYVDIGAKFRHPPGWKRLSKSRKDVLSFIYLDHFNLFFGTPIGDDLAIFSVGMLDGLPSAFDLDEVISSSKDPFRREMAHGKEYVSKEPIDIDGNPAVLAMSPPFKRKGKSMRTVEAFFINQNRRFLLMGFAPTHLFDSLLPVFKEMILSFKLEKHSNTLKPEGALRDQVTFLIKTMDTLVEKRDIDPGNLFMSLKGYRKASLLLNAYDYKKVDPERDALLASFKKAKEILETKYHDALFRIKKGIKVKNFESVYYAADDILKMIPDVESQKHQKALSYVRKYRSVIETKKKR